MTIDKLMRLYKNCYLAYNYMIELNYSGIDNEAIDDIKNKIRELHMKEVDTYKIIDKKNLTQISIKEYYDKFNKESYEPEHIDCHACKFETCVSCIANLIKDLYKYDDEFKEDFNNRYKIIETSK